MMAIRRTLMNTRILADTATTIAIPPVADLTVTIASLGNMAQRICSHLSWEDSRHWV
jgi:hypothetical protein